jgi:transposase
MPRSLTTRKPKAAEIRQLNKLLEEPLTAWQCRRAEVILLYAAGMNAVDIAQTLDVHFNAIYADLRAFDQQGLASIKQTRSVGAPARITDAQTAEILRLAELPPYELGLPYGRWSVEKLRR